MRGTSPGVNGFEGGGRRPLEAGWGPQLTAAMEGGLSLRTARNRILPTTRISQENGLSAGTCRISTL